METMIKSRKVRVIPTESQLVYFFQATGASRWAYNLANYKTA